MAEVAGAVDPEEVVAAVAALGDAAAAGVALEGMTTEDTAGEETIEASAVVIRATVLAIDEAAVDTAAAEGMGVAMVDTVAAVTDTVAAVADTVAALNGTAQVTATTDTGPIELFKWAIYSCHPSELLGLLALPKAA